MQLTRMFFNQPSRLQPMHHMHGVNVLAHPDGDNMLTVYFLAGDVISGRYPALYFSKGWK